MWRGGGELGESGGGWAGGEWVNTVERRFPFFAKALHFCTVWHSMGSDWGGGGMD